jgi:cytosine deaminase
MTPYFEELRAAVRSLGGLFNAHLHLDRAGTYHDTVELLRATGVTDGASLSLPGKHAVVPMVHQSPAYDPDQLYARVERYVIEMISVGTTRADTVVDTTADRVGMTALETFSRLKQRYAGEIDLRVGAYSPLGFRDDEPQRWQLLEKGAAFADFIGLLPERDDTEPYPQHIGFDESCRRALSLAFRLGKQIHIHVDQAFHQYEGASESIVRIVRDLGLGLPPDAEPFIWLIHFISPSTYDEPRFARLASALAELNIGVICCPAAAISMRQYRPFMSPTYNCIARVLDLMAVGVQVRIGSDNVCDITSPMGTVDLIDEVLVLGNAMRYYDINFLARVAAGKRLDEDGLVRLRAHLADNNAFVESIVRRYAPDSLG